jgi:hypothetical protein
MSNMSANAENPMEQVKLGTVIATRKLTLAGVKTVTVRIGKPELFPDGLNWYCPYQVDGIGNGRVRRAGGIDAVQALQLALKMIGADLYTSAEARSGSLTWDAGKEQRDLGFPVPDAIKDLAP